MKKKPAKKTNKRISVMSFVAHNDDHTIGAGGTLAKYASEGKRFGTYIFSYGENSHPWLKPLEIAHMRYKESLASDKIIGGHDVTYFGLKEGKFADKDNAARVHEEMQKLIKKHNPEKIFTHSADDPHPDHRAVHKVVIEGLKKAKYKGDVYTFAVWHLIKLNQRADPKMVVDITPFFKRKIKSFYAHKSQYVSIWLLLWKIYMWNYWDGLKNNCKVAETFYRYELK